MEKKSYLTEIQNKLLDSIKEIEKQTARLKNMVSPEAVAPEHIPAISKPNVLKFRDAIKKELKSIDNLLIEYEEMETKRKFAEASQI